MPGQYDRSAGYRKIGAGPHGDGGIPAEDLAGGQCGGCLGGRPPRSRETGPSAPATTAGDPVRLLQQLVELGYVDAGQAHEHQGG